MLNCKNGIHVMVAVLLVTQLLVMGCNKSEKVGVAKEAGKTDFEYVLNETGDGIIIQKYIGKGKNIIIPKEIDGIPVLKLDTQAFYENKKIISVIIPDPIKVEKYQFYSCSELRNVVLPKSLKVIPEHFFNFCVNLTSIIIPDGIETIETFAFASCRALTRFNIPDSVTTIESGAFFDCQGLLDVTLAGHPIEYTGQDVFGSCPNIIAAARNKITDSGYSGYFDFDPPGFDDAVENEDEYEEEY